jgi:hypothetical protein
MRTAPVLVLALLGAVAAAAPAFAQGGGTVTISIQGLGASATAQAGQTHTAQFTVQVEASGFQCTQASTMSIDVSVANAAQAPPGATASVDPPNITLPVNAPAVYGLPTGPTPLPVGQPFNASGTATFKLVTEPTATGSFPASIQASFKGGALDNCQGTLPAATASATHTVTIQGGSAPGNSTNGTSPSPTPTPTPGGNSTTPPPPPAKTPGFEAVGALVASLGVAVALRRRRA